MTRPATYAVQDGCHNCRHVWTPNQHPEQGERYICTAYLRPEPGENAGACLRRIEDGNTRNVDPAGKCGEWLGPDTTQEGGE